MISPVRTSDLSPTLRCDHYEMTYPIPSEFGAWALQQGAYARGSDFTSLHRNPLRQGRSMLARLWRGEVHDDEKQLYDHAHVWSIMRHDECIALVLLEGANSAHPDNHRQERHCAGRVSLWTHPKYRRQSMMESALGAAWTDIADMFKDQQWYVRGTDATYAIVPKYWDVLVTDGLSPQEDTAIMTNGHTYKKRR